MGYFIGEAIVLAISIAASYAATVLTKTKSSKSTAQDYPTILAQRGSYAPRLMGVRKLGFTFTWAGDRKIKGGGGGGKGGGGGSSSQTYYESGMHVLCVGPAQTLYEIRQSGKVIWTGPIDSGSSPSGTSIDCDNGEGTFRIYWGESTQPPDSYLQTMIGCTSAWPLYCYVVWQPKKLGGGPTWPAIEYVLSCIPAGSTQVNGGVNVKDAISDLLFSPWPQGCGISSSIVDSTGLTHLGTQSASENFGVNFLIENGDTVDEWIAKMMQDFGFVFPQKFDVLYPYAIRSYATAGLTNLDADLVDSTSVEQTREQGDLRADKLMFYIEDPTLNYRDRDITTDLDGQALSRNRPHLNTTQIETVTNVDMATDIAKRMQQVQSVGSDTFKVTAFRDARILLPGTPFTITGVAGYLRLASRTPSFDDMSVQLTALYDQFGYTQSTSPYQGGGNPDPNLLGPLPDIFTRMVQGPARNGTPTISIGRVRAHEQIIGAEVWISANGGSSFFKLGNVDLASPGGVLLDPILITDGTGTPVTIGSGPTVENWGPDWPDDVVNLTGNDVAWKGGQQLLTIADEVFYLHYIDVVSPGIWRLRDMIRAQEGTAVAAHGTTGSGSKFIVQQRPDIILFQHPVIIAGAVIYMKTRPFTSGGIVDLSTVTATFLTIV